jgi:hypothetical protein
MAFAEADLQQEAFPWKLHLVLHSKKQLEIAQADGPPTKEGPQDHLFLAAHVARMKILDETHVRFELSMPVHVSLHSPGNPEPQSDMVFKSIVVNIPQNEIEHLVELQQQPFVVFDELSEQRILAFAKDVEAGELLDKQINYFSNAMQLPQLRILEGLRIYLPVEDIGRPEGSYARVMVIASLKGYLSWFTQTPPSIPIERPLERVYRTFSRYNSVISSYLKGLLQMDSRRQNLKRVGWLNSLVKKQETIKHEPAQIDNLVRLHAQRRCSALF